MKKNNMKTCLFMGLALLNISCSERYTEQYKESNVRLFTVEDAGMMATQDFPGRVVAAKEVNMAFKVSGTLMRVFVKEGSRVSKGQLVAEMDSRDYRIQLDAAEAEYMRIKSEAERVMELYADSVGTADAYDKARYGLRQVKASYENARNQLEYTKIYAPFDGYVQKLLFDPPTVMSAGTPVVTLVADEAPEIEINIPVATYVLRKDIASWSASFDFIPDKSVQLDLISIAPKANSNQLYAVRLAVPDRFSRQISLGMNAMVKVMFNDVKTAKNKIPSSALFNKNGCSCVWVYDENSGRIGKREVLVERLDTEGNAIVTQGLSAGERVVVVGVHRLTDKQRVKPVESESETNVGGLL